MPLYVNLFIPSELNWREKGIRVRQDTTFPEESRTRLALTVDRPIQLAVNLRIPAWVASPPLITINGEQVAATGTPSSYVSLQRTWKSGDTIEMSLPMAVRAEVMPDDSSLAAICYGPLVLAASVDGERGKVIGPMGPDLKKVPPPALPALKLDADSPAASVRAADQHLTFRVPAQTKELEFAPFYQVSGQRYSIYWRVT